MRRGSIEFGRYCPVYQVVLCPAIHIAMYPCVTHLYEKPLPPNFVIRLFQIHEYGERILVHLKAVLDLLCQSYQLVLCGVVSPETSLTWRYDFAVLQPPVQTFVDHSLSSFPIHDFREIGM